MKRLIAALLILCFLFGALLIPSYAASNYYYDELFLEKLEQLEEIINKDGLINSYNERVLQLDYSADDEEHTSLIILESDGVHFVYFYADKAKIEMSFNKKDMRFVNVEVISTEGYVFKATAILDSLNYKKDEDENYRFSYDYTKGTTSKSNHFANLLFKVAFSAWHLHLRRAAEMYISELGFANYCPGHTRFIAGDISQQPSCTQEGRQEYLCYYCGLVYEERAIPKTNHVYKADIVPATDRAEGKAEKICIVCGNIQESTSIAKIASVKLEKTTFVYDGKKKKPKVIVKDSKGDGVSTNNYTVTYSDSAKRVGSYTATVVFKGNYSGKFVLQFKVIPAKVTELKKIGKKLVWEEAKGAQKYIVYYSESKDGIYKKLGSTTKTAFSLKKLELGKAYYFKIRTYAKVDGKAMYGGYSNILKAKLK